MGAEEVELIACREGVKLAAGWVPRPAILESDCLVAINFLRRPGDQRSQSNESNFPDGVVTCIIVLLTNRAAFLTTCPERSISLPRTRKQPNHPLRPHPPACASARPRDPPASARPHAVRRAKQANNLLQQIAARLLPTDHPASPANQTQTPHALTQPTRAPHGHMPDGHFPFFPSKIRGGRGAADARAPRTAPWKLSLFPSPFSFVFSTPLPPRGLLPRSLSRSPRLPPRAACSYFAPRPHKIRIQNATGAAAGNQREKGQRRLLFLNARSAAGALGFPPSFSVESSPPPRTQDPDPFRGFNSSACQAAARRVLAAAGGGLA
ncbi:hypothetical protein HU200_012446 [Digitaria exilis]|uniref:Uncharacterized protein n=1 Tax=Digitaria exilis TaxID=1010633 RepID=A0A835KLV0_9POAL|nr:hypothetical protein HU200_012446 [Digitaria exilis]